MNVLSINFNHDGAAVLLRDGNIAGFVSTERFSRRKKHPGVRVCDIEEVLAQAGLGLSDINVVQLVNLNYMDSPDIPRLHGTDLKSTWPPFWIDGTYRTVRMMDQSLQCWVVPEKMHHMLHAATAYYFSPFDSCVSFACDPIGAQAHFAKDGRSVGAPLPVSLVAPTVYDFASAHVFGNGLFGAGKLMGLAPYGAEAARKPVDYGRLMALPPELAFAELVKASAETPVAVEESGRTLDAALAWHAQAFLEAELTRAFAALHAKCLELDIEPNLCMSGGTALNSVANQRCFEQSPFTNLYLHPACGDDGTAIGAALMMWHHMLQQPKRPRSNREAMYSRRSYDAQIPDVLRANKARLEISTPTDVVRETARAVADGQVIGWFQGASEIGPRALGNRSIVADPRSPRIKDYLNSRVKQREGFRPFAPSVLVDHARAWFGTFDSPFMLRVGPVRNGALPGITHVDGTARFQTVCNQDNPRYHELIHRFFEITGVPAVLNTSFNGKNEPIVETPQDAIDCLFSAKLDAVAFPGFLVRPRSV